MRPRMSSSTWALAAKSIRMVSSMYIDHLEASIEDASGRT